MFTVYVLENTKGTWYTGVTNNLHRRLHDHQTQQVYTTKRIGGPWKLIYTESCLNEFDAKKRERFLKTIHGKALLKKRLRYYLVKH